MGLTRLSALTSSAISPRAWAGSTLCSMRVGGRLDSPPWSSMHAPRAWRHWRGTSPVISTHLRNARKKLDELQAAGVQGVKVDFWCSDRQESIAAMQALFEDAASRQL